MSSLLHAKRALERRVPGCVVFFDVARTLPSDAVVGVLLRGPDGTEELARGADHLGAIEASMGVLDAWDSWITYRDFLVKTHGDRECAGDHARLMEGE